MLTVLQIIFSLVYVFFSMFSNFFNENIFLLLSEVNVSLKLNKNTNIYP